MTITATFNTYDEMVEFAKNLITAETKTAVEPQAEEPVEVPFKEEPEEKPAPAAPEKTYTMTQVRAFLGNLRKAGKKDAVTALIYELGYEKFTDIPEEKYGELMKKAEEL